MYEELCLHWSGFDDVAWGDSDGHPVACAAVEGNPIHMASWNFHGPRAPQVGVTACDLCDLPAENATSLRHDLTVDDCIPSGHVNRPSDVVVSGRESGRRTLSRIGDAKLQHDVGHLHPKQITSVDSVCGDGRLCSPWLHIQPMCVRAAKTMALQSTNTQLLQQQCRTRHAHPVRSTRSNQHPIQATDLVAPPFQQLPCALPACTVHEQVLSGPHRSCMGACASSRAFQRYAETHLLMQGRSSQNQRTKVLTPLACTAALR